MVGLLMGTLFLCLFFTVPIFVSLAISTVVTFAFYFPDMGDMLTQAMVSSMDSFPLMAIPFFMLVGSLMEKTSIADKLV
ncbi:MAG: TRAP transporter large permease subunit, partial [Anaerotruncus rubiinfantis]